MARASAAEWARRVERWKDSGLTAKEFAAEAGVNASTLSNWGWKLSRASAETRQQRRPGRVRVTEARGGEQPRRASAPQPRFLELPAVEVAVARPELEVIVGERVRIRIPAGFDDATLGRVLRAVGVAP